MNAWGSKGLQMPPGNGTSFLGGNCLEKQADKTNPKWNSGFLPRASSHACRDKPLVLPHLSN